MLYCLQIHFPEMRQYITFGGGDAPKCRTFTCLQHHPPQKCCTVCKSTFRKCDSTTLLGGVMRQSVEHSQFFKIDARLNAEHSNFSEIRAQTVQHFWGGHAPECRAFATFFLFFMLFHSFLDCCAAVKKTLAEVTVTPPPQG